MKTTTSQRKELYRLFGYNKETEAMHVQQITQNPNKKKAADLTLDQAAKLIGNLTTHWGKFDFKNQQHKYILSLLRQMGWTKTSERHGIVADIERLSTFLKSNKSPVPKPLLKMGPEELTTLINCLESMLAKKFKAK